MSERDMFFKYLTPSADDADWGLFLNVTGYAHVAPNDDYPPRGHPVGYNFNWDHGRVLQEYQLNYITEGSGMLETDEAAYRIYPGTVLFIHPNTRHRYRPDKKTGWKEHYIGFNGDFTRNIFHEKFIPRQRPLLYIGFQDSIIEQFGEIYRQVKDEKPGYQQVCAGIVMHLVSNVLSIHKNKEFSGKEVERKIRRACIILRENLHTTVNVEQLARDLHLGYSHFRRVFKRYTGLSPAQYQLSLRLQKSKELLMQTNLSVKQIAYEMGFQSNHYFTRIFTRKMGVSPTGLRKNQSNT